MIVYLQHAICDKCGFVGPTLSESAFWDYMEEPTGDGQWYGRKGELREVCHGCIVARACRIFGHVPDESNDWQCTRCMKRIGPSFAYAESCHFCGTIVKYKREYSGAPHSAKDCRPDLFEHEVGSTCTWGPDRGCYWDHDNHELTRLGAWWERVA